jgi:hypothetical protein
VDVRRRFSRGFVSLPTVERLEAKPGELFAHAPTRAALTRAFEVAGVSNSSTKTAVGLEYAFATTSGQKNANNRAHFVAISESKPIAAVANDAGECAVCLIAVIDENGGGPGVRLRER